MGAVFLGNLDRILPHIIVFCVQFRFAVGNGIGRQTDSGEHITYLEYQCVVILLLTGVVFIHGDVPFFLHVPDELLFVPFSLGQQHKAGEDACVVTLVLGLCLGPLCDLLLTRLDHRWGILILRVQLRPTLGVGDGLSSCP